MNECHYVELDPMPTANSQDRSVHVEDTVHPVPHANDDENITENASLDDNIIHQGDEHIIQITGGASVSSIRKP